MSKVAEFSVEQTQYLDSEGQAVRELPQFAKDRALMLQFYRTMQTIRVYDAKAIALQRTGKIGGTFPSSLGQEALMTGVGQALQADDVFCSSYREQGVMMQRGASMTHNLLYWGGDERGNDFATHREDTPICVPIATQCLHAAGIATAIQYRQQARAVLVMCGDGATSKGDFLEALNVAGAWHLPLVFVINNNQWAISVPRKSQSGAQTLAQKAIAGGFTGEQVDGNDVLAVYDRVQQALSRARQGQGPHLIEAVTYRLGDHTTADDAKRYRSAEEWEQAQAKEPIKRFLTFLKRDHTFSTEEEQSVMDACKSDIEAAVHAYTNTPPVAPETMFDYLFAELPEALKEQRETLSIYAAGDQHHA